MKIQMLAGAACAALMGFALPAEAATAPQFAPHAALASQAADAIEAFYARRQGAPVWLAGGPDSPAARELIAALRRSPLDGFASGPVLAAQADRLIAQSRTTGDRASLANADRLLSAAWVRYVQALQQPPAGMKIADSWVAPRVQPAQEILTRLASARSTAEYVRKVSSVNPIYAELRDAAFAQAQANGGVADPRVLASLDRIRAMPFQKRYVVVDAASAKLWMVEDGRIVDSMKVIVGKPSTQTPMLASTIYRATLNPYWNVPQDMVQSLIAPRVLDQGIDYLKARGYEVLSEYSVEAEVISPKTVDWRAVAEGREVVKVRQLPGPANSMGDVKFGFPNSNDIFLHDTPKKELFASTDRDVSNGCIRLEDADRLARWLIGHEPTAATDRPEQHVLLTTPVPIYITYLTAQAGDGQLTFVNDVYGRDAQRTATIASLR